MSALTCCWEFNQQPDDTEQVDVSIVDSEVKEHGTSTTVQPQVLFQVGNHKICHILPAS